MKIFILISVIIVACEWSEGTPTSRVVEPANEVSHDGLDNTELLLTFVVFRHGDRTPDMDELALYPEAEAENKDIFFPYGKKALTNKGKQRGFFVGKYLRKHLDGFLSCLYLPDEITVRTTAYARTKMTALTALAGLYPPPPAQRWNPLLNWQPIPYDTLDGDDDDLLYYYNCPRYIALRDQVYQQPQIKKSLLPYEGLFEYLQKHTGTNITTPEQVFYLDNLFQTLSNVGVHPPKWAQEMMPQIKEVTKIEYASEFYNPELIRLAGGVFMNTVINASKAYIEGNTEQPKARLYSAHENNVAAAMAAARVFIPHQPQYGSTISIEFRKDKSTGQYGFAAVYAPVAGGPGKILAVDGCGGAALCDYDKFLTLVKDVLISEKELRAVCPKMP